MSGTADHGEPIAGYFAPVHRALTEQILLGGAPRSYSPKKKVMRRPSLVRALIVKVPSGTSIGKVGTSLKRAKPMDSASRAVITGS